MRRWLVRGAFIALVLVGIVAVFNASAAPVIPVPSPVVKVHTESGGVVRDRVIPLGGVPVPLDVDDRSVGGLLSPDVLVSVGMIAVDELPGRPIVPTVEIRRDPTAILRNAPAPPLKIEVTIELIDAGNLEHLATVTHGYNTPKGGLVPPVFRSKLVGPITGGFIDPLEAIVETPGYSGPLDINAGVDTDDFKGTFGVSLDPLPERIHFIEDPRDDGLDFTYDHSGPHPDVKLHATAHLTDPDSGDTRTIDATVERLPANIELSSTTSEQGTDFEYTASSFLGKPDLEASYRNTRGDGTVLTDANVKIAGLPFHMKGTVAQDPNDAGGATIDEAEIEVLDGAQMDAVEFLARNYTGPGGPIPEPALRPEQYLDVATRVMPDGSQRMRAAGRLVGVRRLAVKRVGDEKDGLDLFTDTGDGTRPLGVRFDLDDRGPEAPDDAKATFVDTQLRNLAARTHVRFEPAGATSPSRITYDASSTMRVDTEARVAEAEGSECGEGKVTCLSAAIDALPPSLTLELPAKGGTDYRVDHTGSTKPTLTATIDRTDVKETDGQPDELDRTWAKIALARLPRHMAGRLDQKEGVLKAAEFHACNYDFSLPGCTDAQDAIGQVEFTVRDRPDRGDLPPRPETARQAVTLMKRCTQRIEPVLPCAEEQMEVHGLITDVRNVAFHQRDIDEDGKADGTLGVLVDAGDGNSAFDTRVDLEDDQLDDDGNLVGPDNSRVSVDVRPLPYRFDACVRSQADAAPTAQPDDPLLEKCDRTTVLHRGDGDPANDDDGDELKSTPLSIHYAARDAEGKREGARVNATVTGTKADSDDLDENGKARVHITDIRANVDEIPGELDADVISPRKPSATLPGRKLEFDYRVPDDDDDATSERIETIDFHLQSRRQGSLCKDPRPVRESLCAHATLKNLSRAVEGTFDPDESKGDLTLSATRDPGEPRPSIDPLKLAKVTPEEGATPLVLDARVTSLSDKLTGKLQQLNLEGEDATAKTGTLAERIQTCKDGDDNDDDGKVDGADPQCGAELARARFDACPDGGACDGIARIRFTATSALVGDPLPPVAHTAGDEKFSFVQRGDHFRARGDIRNLRQIELTKLRDDGTPSPVTRMSAAFGTGAADERLHAVVDRDAGGGDIQLVDATLRDMPRRTNVCFREPVAEGDLLDSGGYCERKDADGDGTLDARRKAIQVSLPDAGSSGPTIAIRRLELGSSSNSHTLRGPPLSEAGNGNPASCGNGADDDGDGNTDASDSDCGDAVKIDKLASEVNILATDDDPATDDVDEKAIQVQGPRTGPNRFAQAAARVSFNLRTLPGTATTGGEFPFARLDGDARDPGRDSANVDPVDGGTNFLAIHKDPRDIVLAGSVPAIARVAMSALPCRPDDPRYPKPSQFPVGEFPAYSFQCIRAQAAAGRPLGVSVRTLDDEDEVVAIENGHLRQVPNGADGLAATIAKAPEELKAEKTCGSAGAPLKCQPPLLVLNAPRGSGQARSDVRLEGRISIGALAAIDLLRDVVPKDVLSDVRAADGVSMYEQDPREFAQPGVRVKTTSGEAGDAVRVGLKLELPKHLSFDPILKFSCSRKDEGGGCTDAGDEAEGVGEDENAGMNTKDIGIKVFGADNDAGTTPVNSLGRISVLIDDPSLEGGQTIITGTPPPDPSLLSQLFGIPDTVGATNWDLEDLPPVGGAHELGFDAPGYLDAQVFLRTDYRAPEGSSQQQYAQVDGRVNRSLSMAVRLQESEAPGRNRSGVLVPKTQLTVRNAPGLGVNAPDFTDPTFRIRAELRKKRAEPPGPPESNEHCASTGDIADVIGDILDLFACYTLKTPTTRWMDVAVNMAPPNGGDPARTIEAVVDSTGRTDADLRAFNDTYAVGTPLAARTPARFTPQANVRVAGLDVGGRIGVNVLSGLAGATLGLGIADGDFRVRALGRAVRRLALSNDVGKVQMKSEGGSARAALDWQGKLAITLGIKLLWVVDKTIVLQPPIDKLLPIDAKPCSAGFLNPFPGGIAIDADEDKSFGVGLGTNPALDIASIIAGGGIPLAIAKGILAIPAGIFCGVMDTSTAPLVSADHPAPRYDDPARDVPGAAERPPVAPLPDTPAGTGGAAPNLTIVKGVTRKLCGDLTLNHLRVFGTLQVGAEGETVTQTIGGVTRTVQCDGSLRVVAQKVTVRGDNTGDNGIITASGLRSTPGSGHPSSVGAGAGHGVDGAAGGLGGSGGGSYTVDPVTADFGSTGGAGTGGVGGGNGGGTIELAARDFISVFHEGRIEADGARGGHAFDAGCEASAGGGGSGGAISLTSNYVRVRGDGSRVRVRGGHGGSGANGGGGGGGGHITINSIVTDASSGNFLRTGGSAGDRDDAEGCADGTTVSAQPDFANNRVERAAHVERVDAPGPLAGESYELELQGLKQGGDVFAIYLCSKGPGGSLEDGGLNPPAEFGLDELFDGHCERHTFKDGRNHDTDGDGDDDAYRKTVTVTPQNDGYYGHYAVGVTPHTVPVGTGAIAAADNPCNGTVAGIDLRTRCTFQDPFPKFADVRVARDTTPPTITHPASGSCPLGSMCTRSHVVRLNLGISDAISGVQPGSLHCFRTIEDDMFVEKQACTPGEQDFGLGGFEGRKVVYATASDNNGNVRETNSEPARYWVDTLAPKRPLIKIDSLHSDEELVNGWHNQHQQPKLEVGVADRGDADTSSGLRKLDVIVNGDPETCADGDLGFSHACSGAAADPFTPTADGTYEFSARAFDTAGNESSPIPDDERPVLRLDRNAPVSDLFLSPEDPDGGGGYYLTPPFIAFAGTDAPGGSGIDPAKDPSGIFYAIDGGASGNYVAKSVEEGGDFLRYDPEAELRLSDGTHSVCWYAVDVAGNAEVGKDPNGSAASRGTNCRFGIRVDGTAPTVALDVDPVAPNGNNDLYTVRPKVGEVAADPGGADASGIARVEYQLDDDAWKPAATIEVGQGIHTVRALAVDVAGNRAPLAERTFAVDTERPEAGLTSYPPAANAHGYFRQARIDTLTADDGPNNSGIAGGQFALDGDSLQPYVGQVAIGDGAHSFLGRVSDRAGLTSQSVTQSTSVDLNAPLPQIATPAPAPLLTSGTTTLRYTVNGTPTPKVKISVLVFNALGGLVRRIAVPGTTPDGYRPAGAGSVTWNGKTDSGTAVLPGAYHYRVQALDQAGNAAISTESRTFLVALAGVTLPPG